jgi:hypothetical protein
MPTDAQLAPAVAALAAEITVTREDREVRTGWRDDEHTGSPQEATAHLGSRIYKYAHTRMTADQELTPRTLHDPEFDAGFRLAAGERTVAADVQLLEERGDEVIVLLDKIRVRAPAEAIEQVGGRTVLQVDWARPLLSPGFFFLTSSTTPMTRQGGALLRLYAHLADPAAGPELLALAAARLEAARVPWQAKAGSNLDMYPRTDALVVYLPRASWAAARPLAEELSGTGACVPGGSVFTHALTDSVSAAFEPADVRPGREGLSFGQHRAQILAEALVSHVVAEDEQSLEGRIAAAFQSASIDPLNPARNLSSPVNPVVPAY